MRSTSNLWCSFFSLTKALRKDDGVRPSNREYVSERQLLDADGLALKAFPLPVESEDRESEEEFSRFASATSSHGRSPFRKLDLSTEHILPGCGEAVMAFPVPAPMIRLLTELALLSSPPWVENIPLSVVERDVEFPLNGFLSVEVSDK